MTSPHPLLCRPLTSLPNGASHAEEDDDEEEQGEKFEFDDEEDVAPTEMKKSEWTADSAVSNLYAQAKAGQETGGQAVNGSTRTGQNSKMLPLVLHSCTGMEVRESPEGRSISSDLGVTEEAESFWKANNIYEGKPSVMAEGDQDQSSSAITQQNSTEDELSSAVRPHTEHRSADGDRPTQQSPETSSPHSEDRDLEVVYDDVPPEGLQLPVDDVDDIYEDIQRPDHRGSNGWSSSEFESYDELSEGETAPPARSKVRR